MARPVHMLPMLALAAALLIGPGAWSAPAAIEREEAAHAAARDGRWAEALAAWRDVSASRPNDPAVSAELGWALMETGDVADARRRFQRALNLEPTNARARAGLVELAIRARRPDEAVRIAQEAVRARPESAEAFLALGDANKAASRRAESEDAYRRAVALEPANPRAHAGLASVLLIRNKSEEALKEYRAAVQGEPNNITYREGLARAAMQDGRYGEAASAFTSAMDIARREKPDWPRLDSLALSLLDALGRASSAVSRGSETRQEVWEANQKALEVADSLGALPVLEEADPTTDPAMAQRSLAFGLIGQAAAADMASLRSEAYSAAESFVLREQARRALMSARSSNLAPTAAPKP